MTTANGSLGDAIAGEAGARLFTRVAAALARLPGFSALPVGLLTALLAAPAAAELPYEEPPRIYVVGPLEPGDTLSVRTGPAGDATRVGGLPPGAGPFEVLSTRITGRTEWAEIAWRGDTQWVAKRFLQEVSPPKLAGTALPIGLQCAGTEPFWGASIDSQSQITWSTPDFYDGFSIAIDTALGASGRLGSPAAIVTDDGGVLTVYPDRCTDGMSEADYPWGATFLRREGGLYRLYEGCCILTYDD